MKIRCSALLALQQLSSFHKQIQNKSVFCCCFVLRQIITPACVPVEELVHKSEREVLKFLHMFFWKYHGLFGIFYNESWQLMHCLSHTPVKQRDSLGRSDACCTRQLYTPESMMVDWRPLQASLVFRKHPIITHKNTEPRQSTEWGANGIILQLADQDATFKVEAIFINFCFGVSCTVLEKSAIKMLAFSRI